jgi:dTDP-4-dehydrorhamnose reductase
LSVVNDQTGSPTWARALAQATAELLQRKELIADRSGVYHVSADGHTSRYDFANAIIRIMAEVSGVGAGWARTKPIRSDQYPLPARRPCNPVTSKDRIKQVFGVELPGWEKQLRAFVVELANSKRPQDRTP